MMAPPCADADHQTGNPDDNIPERIYKIAPDGTASYFVGNQNGTTGYADGAGNAAMFDRPAQLSIDAAGNLYVADSGTPPTQPRRSITIPRQPA